MSTVVFHTEPAIFTFALPVPTAFDPEYLKYAQKIRDLAVCVQDVPVGKNPRLQVTAEYPMDECGDLPKLVDRNNCYPHTFGYLRALPQMLCQDSVITRSAPYGMMRCTHPTL